MAVTELALLRIISSSTGDNTKPSSEMMEKLRLAKDAMEKASGFKFSYLHCIEDPGHIFIVGGWPSVQFHTEKWIPSSENQDLLKLMQGEVDVEWMFHLDLDPKDAEDVFGRQVVAVGRYVVKEGARDDLTIVSGEIKEKLELTGGGECIVKAGWRIDRGYVEGYEYEWEMKDEELVLFTGCGSVEEHLDFEKMEELSKTSKIRESMKAGGSKHGVLLNV